MPTTVAMAACTLIPYDPITLNPYSRQPKPRDEDTTEGLSSEVCLSGAEVRSSTNSEHAITSAESPAMMKNMSCQLALSMMRPATVGPIAGANAMTTPNRPIALPRLSTGKVSMSTVITIGMRMPAPAACSKRPASSTGNDGPQPASRLPAVKMPIATTNRLRVE